MSVGSKDAAEVSDNNGMATARLTMPVPASAKPAERVARDSSFREVLLLGTISCVVFVGLLVSFGGYAHRVANFGDNVAYARIADGVRHWKFSGLMIKQFWGVSFLMAAISAVTGLATLQALIVISVSCYFVSLALAYHLWGERVAGVFAVLNFYWLQLSFLGGSEPLFVALLYASFLAARRRRWFLASLLAALCTSVRPLGFLAVLALGLALLWRRDYRKLLPVSLIAGAIGFAYVLTVKLAVGDALATVHSYTRTGSSHALFGIPFYAIAQAALSGTVPLTNLALSLGWVGFAVGGMLLFLPGSMKCGYGNDHLPEVLFSAGYLGVICSYNLPHWALGNFARFAIPIVPFATLGWLPWIPRSRWFLRTLAILSPALAACSSIGILDVIHRLRG